MSADRLVIRSGGPLCGNARVPGDKSISHRALIFNGFATGRARIDGLLDATDVGSTATCMQTLGVELHGSEIVGTGGHLVAPAAPLDCGNSGTTFRLLLGLLAGQPFSATLTGDSSLAARPMARVTTPLTRLGARFDGPDGGAHAPVTVHGGALVNLPHHGSIASAQVKTALILAGLQGTGTMVIEEPSISRDHTERMLQAMGIDLERKVGPDGVHRITLEGGQVPHANDVQVPGDISSAAFLIVAGCITPGSDLFLEHVGLNPTRTGILDVLGRMGARVTVESASEVSGEPVGTLRVRGSELHGTEVCGAEIPRLIDEIPVLAVAAAYASGVTRIRDAAELRVKESDRIAATATFLRRAGVQVETHPDGLDIHGTGGHLEGFEMEAQGDHRIAMAALVAGLAARGETVVSGATTIGTSFPTFSQLMESLRG